MPIDLLCSISCSSEAELCLRYWARKSNAGWRESLAGICEAFGINAANLEDRISVNCTAYVPGIRCPHCAVPRAVTSRAEYEKLLATSDVVSLPCQSVKCELGRRPLNTIATAASFNRRADVIGEVLEKLRRDLQPTDYQHLTHLEAYYLCCVLLASDGEWHDNELPPLVAQPIQLAPTQLLANQIFARLRKQNLIVPSIRSPISAFNLANFERAPITFDMARVGWTIAEHKLCLENNQILEILRSSFKSAPTQTREQLRLVLTEHECLSALISCLHKFEPKPHLVMEAQLLTAIQHGLRNLPVSVTISIVRQLFIDTKFCRKLRGTKHDAIARFVSDSLHEQVDSMAILGMSPNIESSVNDKIFERSESLVSRFYWESFLRSSQPPAT